MSEAIIVDTEVRASFASCNRFSAQSHIKGRVGLFSAAFVELCGERRERQDSG
jgi:hypothetical protein